MKLNLEKYDKLVWRLNGSFLFLACLFALVICTILGFNLLNETFGTPQVHDLVNVDQKTQKEEFLRLGFFQSLKGTDLILIPLTFEQNYESSYESKLARNRARNFLIFDSKSKKSQWIWNSNASLILEDTEIHNQIKNKETQKTKGIVFEFVDTDSNTDGVLNEKDQKSLQYFDLASRKAVEVIRGVDRSIGVQQTGDDEVLFFYSRSGKSYFKSFAVSGLKLSEEKEIEQQK